MDATLQHADSALAQFVAPLEKPHGVEKYRLERKGRRSFNTELKYIPGNVMARKLYNRMVGKRRR
jgi:hypothetical protein